MTISSNNYKNTYAGNGSTTVFAYTFRILADSNILVQFKNDTTGVFTTKTLTTDYTVSGAGDAGGGNVTMVTTTAASGETVVITRSMPFQQNTDYTENDVFPAETHEEALDELTMNDLQLKEESDRTLRVDQAVTGFDTTVPDPTASANQSGYLRINAAGTALEAATLSSTAGINEVVDDPSPQLGADLDCNSYDIQMDDATGIRDDSDNEQLIFQKTASAVNHIEMTNAATGNSPLIKAVGSDTNVDARIASQGTGDVRLEADTAIVTGTAASAGEIRVGEDTDNGTNYMGFKAPAAVTTSTTLTLPDGDGSANQILETDGAGTLSWVAKATDTNDWELIASATASSSATVDFTGLTSSYVAYRIVGAYVKPATDNVDMYFRTSTDGGSSYAASATDYEYSGHVIDSAGSQSTFGSAGAAQITMWDNQGNAAGESGSFTLDIFNPSAADHVTVVWVSNFAGATTVQQWQTGGGRRDAAADVDAIRFLYSSGNVASGEFRLYGMKGT